MQYTGETTATIHYVHTTTSGMRMDNYPVTTKFFPALAFSLLGRPHWLFAFFGGVLASLWVDDKYEAIFLERVIVPLVLDPYLGDTIQTESQNFKLFQENLSHE